MHLVEYKLFPFNVKLLHPMKIKLTPIQNFFISLVSILNRKQTHGSSKVFVAIVTILFRLFSCKIWLGQEHMFFKELEG